MNMQGAPEEILLDDEGHRMKCLQEYLDLPEQILEYDYENQLVDDIGRDQLIEIKRGRSFIIEDEWAANNESGGVGEEGYEDMHQRSFKKGGRIWRESWFNRIKELPRGSDEARQTFENKNFNQNNLDMSQENERQNNISRISDKWQIDLNTGEFKEQKEEKPMYSESSKIRDLFGTGWDERHQKYGSGPIDRRESK